MKIQKKSSTGAKIEMNQQPASTVSFIDQSEMFYPVIFLLYYMFCCCFCSGKNTESPHKSVMRKFTQLLHLKGNDKDALDNLMRLYA